MTTGGSADPDGGSMHFHQYGDETTTTRHVWYTIYHHLPVVKRVPSNPLLINQPMGKGHLWMKQQQGMDQWEIFRIQYMEVR